MATRLLTALVACMAVAIFTACGSDSDDFVAQADEICASYEDRYGDSGNRGETPSQIAEEMAFLSEVSAARQEALAELEPPSELEEAWTRFQESGEAILQVNRRVIAAAREGDVAKMNQTFIEFEEPSNQRQEAADELGFEVCGQPTSPEVEETGTGPSEGDGVPMAEESVEGAAQELIRLATDEDCEEIPNLTHPDLGFIDQGTCRQIATQFSEAEVLGTEDYGPAAVAEIENPDGNFFTVYFVIGDEDRYRFVGYVHNDGRGLRPAPEQTDLEDVVPAVLEAAASESGVPDDLLAFPGEDPVSIELREALSSEPEESPTRVGLNQAYAFYYLGANERKFVLVFAHMPGGRGEYRLYAVHEIQQA